MGGFPGVRAMEALEQRQAKIRGLVPHFINTLTYYFLQKVLLYGMLVTMEVTHAAQKPVPYNSESR